MTSPTPDSKAALREKIERCLSNAFMNQEGVPFDTDFDGSKYVDELITLFNLECNAARIDEEYIHLKKLQSGDWISYGTEVTNRLAELQAPTTAKEQE